jgi:hypothetical protein
MKITRLEIANKGSRFEMYVGDAISTCGVFYHFWKLNEVYGAMREENLGRLRVGTPVTPPLVLKSAIRRAILSLAHTPMPAGRSLGVIVGAPAA